jgi:hypothetical protein
VSVPHQGVTHSDEVGWPPRRGEVEERLGTRGHAQTLDRHDVLRSQTASVDDQTGMLRENPTRRHRDVRLTGRVSRSPEQGSRGGMAVRGVVGQELSEE